MSEGTPVADVPPIVRSALAAEQQTERFARAGGRGVVLRLGLLDGPGTWYHEPMGNFGAKRDGERVSTERLTLTAGWHPQQ
ncbi:MAG: hypothetical protein ACJ77M_03835 [Thermoleophilaceae bacterium]